LFIGLASASLSPPSNAIIVETFIIVFSRSPEILEISNIFRKKIQRKNLGKN